MIAGVQIWFLLTGKNYLQELLIYESDMPYEGYALKWEYLSAVK